MSSNTKLLAIFSLLILVLGFGLLWFGLDNQKFLQQSPSPDSALKKETTEAATSSGSATSAPLSTGTLTTSAALGIEGERAKVTEVVDGDTFKIESGQTVRLIGIDTPETKDPRRVVGCFGKEASFETKKIIEGKLVILEKDISETDKYKRLLRYVYLPLENGQLLFVNDYLVREGFAKVLTYPPDIKYNEQFRQAESGAREAKRGLWGRC